MLHEGDNTNEEESLHMLMHLAQELALHVLEEEYYGWAEIWR